LIDVRSTVLAIASSSSADIYVRFCQELFSFQPVLSL
jgi:hypothetical protein